MSFLKRTGVVFHRQLVAFGEPSREKLLACFCFSRNRCMRRSTGLVGRYGAQTSLAACDRRAKTALTGSCQRRHFSRRRLGRAAAARVLSWNNPIIPSARVTGGKLVAVRGGMRGSKKVPCHSSTQAAAQQRSSAAALGRADQMVKADRRHSGGGSLRRVDHSGGGSHAESGQTEYIMLLVICLDFLHFSTSSAHAHTHAHVLCTAVSAGVRLVSAKEPY